jgi:hypothetical protein
MIRKKFYLLKLRYLDINKYSFDKHCIKEKIKNKIAHYTEGSVKTKIRKDV